MSAELDWPEVRLEEVADEITVGFVGPMADEYRSTGVPFFRSLNIKPFRVEPEDLKFISPEFHHRIRKSRLKPGDVVIIRTGDPGTATVIPDTFTDANCSDLVIVRPSKELNPHFLAYYVNAVAHHQIAAQVVGAVQQHFNVGSAKQLTLTLPSRAEQDAIADVLRVFDRKLELNRRMNRTLENLAGALFRAWFVDFEPVVAKAAGRAPFGIVPTVVALFPSTFTDSELGPIPHGWRVGTIEELARYVNGRAFTKGASGTGRMVIRIAELNSGPGGSTVYSDAATAADNTAQPGDLLFAWSGSLDVYRWHRDEALINQHIFKVVCEAYPQWFVHHALREAMPFFQDVAADKATTMGHIKREHLSEAKLALPPGELVTAASRVIEPLYAKHLANDRESLTLAALRDTLLPKLLSGELRVKNAETLAIRGGTGSGG